MFGNKYSSPNYTNIIFLFYISTFLNFIYNCWYLLFFNSNQNKKNTILEEHLKSKNLSFKKEIDSLFLIIEINNKKLNKITDTIYLYQKKKDKIKIVYYEKTNKINVFSLPELTNEFDSIFAKNNVN